MPNLVTKVLFSDVVKKTGESPSDCQDACVYNHHLGRYAIADGVTGSFFPAEWAKMLVEYFCNQTNENNFSIFETQDWRKWLAPIQEQWEKEIKEKVNRKASDINAFHLRNSLAQREPAGATFVGLQFTLDDKPFWRSMIIGDSCLFQIRGEHLTSYSVKTPSDFSYHPEYFASIDIHNKYEPVFFDKTVHLDDIFILATDALAKWILSRNSEGGILWQDTIDILTGIGKWDDFYKFVEQTKLESQNPLEDDDVALMVISVVDEDKGQMPEPFLLKTDQEAEQSSVASSGLQQVILRSNVKSRIQIKPRSVIPRSISKRSWINPITVINVLLLALIASIGLNALMLLCFENSMLLPMVFRQSICP